MKDELLSKNEIPNEDIGADDVELTELIDQEIISKLDSIKTSTALHKKYSEIYRGGVLAIRSKNRLENPDWMAQSANSFREIIYILQKTEHVEIEKILNDRFKKTLTKRELDKYRGYLASLYQLFSDTAHHFSEVPDINVKKYLIAPNVDISINPLSTENYITAVRLYTEYLKLLIVTTLDIHKKIDQCVSDNNRDRDLIQVFFDNSRDSKIYLLSLLDQTWLTWLWTNCFFAFLKEPAEDITKYSYQIPELDYLTRMAEKDPKTVCSIIKSIPISVETFNPEVVDRFIWIIGLLPPDEIKELLPKILSDRWGQLMAPFNKSGHEYQKLVEKLHSVKDYEALTKLAQILLCLRSNAELADVKRYSISDNLFYINDISEIGIFDAIVDPENVSKENALGVLLPILGEIVQLGGKGSEGVFEYTEPFYLLDVDLFTIEIESNNRADARDDIQNFVALCKKLIEILFSLSTDNELEAKRIYDTYLLSLPDSYTLFRLRIFAMSQCPIFFKKELGNSLFRVFNPDGFFHQIDAGAEYHHTLIACFGVLDDGIKREYIKNVFEYFGAILEDPHLTQYRRQHGLQVLKCIKSYLDENEMVQAELIFGKFRDDEDLVPQSRTHMRSGSVHPRSHVNVADYSVEQIAEHLKSDWAPGVLDEQFEGDDFLSPRGAEGLAEALREDVKTRAGDYFAHLNKFFDRSLIDPSYTYAILHGVSDILQSKKILSDQECVLLIDFFNTLRQSGEAVEFEPTDGKSYLPDWISVHRLTADILLRMLDIIKNFEVFTSNRNIILTIIKYLLSIKDRPKTGDKQTDDAEPSYTAINSVQGVGFQSLVQFVNNDGQKLASDVKDLYSHILEIDGLGSVRFMIGKYLASFYFRDKVFIRELLPSIFPYKDPEKEKAHFTAWEGYLSASLYGELFNELKDYYLHAVSLKKESYPDRKYLKGLDETLAYHIALAYAQFDLKIGDTLFDNFWSEPNETRHYEFISFVGRHYLTRDQAGDEWMLKHKADKEKIIAFWSWVLEAQLPIEPKAYSGFGFWVNPDKEVIADEILIPKIAASLKKSKGEIDWDYGLLQCMDKFAEIKPKETLDIITSIFILDDGLNPHHRTYFDAAGQIKGPLQKIYTNEELKLSVSKLINFLIEKGSSTFWGLKDILKNDSLD